MVKLTRIGLKISLFILIGCNENNTLVECTDNKDIGSKFGTTWFYQYRLDGRIHKDPKNRNYNDVNGTVFFSSGIMLDIDYNKQVDIEVIRPSCYDCGGYKHLSEEFKEWSIQDDSLIISYNGMTIDKYRMRQLNKDTVELVYFNDLENINDTLFMIRVSRFRGQQYN
jgi:hypothetical protein